MGSYLDKPETTKKSAIEQNEFLELGSSSMQVIYFDFNIQTQSFKLIILSFPGMAHKPRGRNL
jgi:hypothetical protein